VKSISVRLGCVVSIAALAWAAPVLRAQQPWQTDWDKFVDELGASLKRGATASEIRNTFGNRPVTWEGSFFRLDTGQSNTAFITMTDRTVTFSDGTSAPMSNPVGWTVKPEELDRWRQFKVGDKVRYSITIVAAGDPFSIFLVTLGKVYLFNTTASLLPLVTTPAVPVIGAGGVVSGASFHSGIVPGSWVTITGTNLSSATDTWDKAILNGKLPTTLDSVSVSIAGKPAYVQFISPGQINVQAPDVGVGPMPVTVSNSNGTSGALTATSQQFGPSFFLWTGKYAVATRVDFSLAAKTGLFPGLATVPASPGDVIILWGTGFGPTNPAVPAGIQVPADRIYSTANPVTVTVGNTGAQMFGAALAPSYAGLYQIAIQIPSSTPDGDIPIKASIGGIQSPDNVFITIQSPPPKPRISASPQSLTFQATANGAAPALQSIALSSSGSPLDFTSAAADSWVTVDPAGGATPSTLKIGASLQGLSAGDYSSNVRINAPGAANPSVTVGVTLHVAPAPIPPAITSIEPSSVEVSQLVIGFRVTGQSLGSSPQIAFDPSDGITVIGHGAAGDLWLQIANDATSGQRLVTAATSAGRTNALPLTINPRSGNFTISNLRVSSSGGVDGSFSVTVDFNDPSGASAGGINYVVYVPDLGFAAVSARPQGVVSGQRSGSIRLDLNAAGRISRVGLVKVNLVNTQGHRSNTLEGTF
jgi:uncharacterized protein (TIGR03437 family)